MSLISRAFQKRDLTTGQGDPWAIPTNGSLGGYTPSGVPVTEDTAMKLVAVLSSVRILANAVAGLPFDAVRQTDGLRKTVSNAPPIVADPFGGESDSSFLTRRTGFVQLMVSILLRGNGYALVVARDRVLRPSRIRVIHPDRVRCWFGDDGKRKYQIDRKDVDTEDMVHLVGLSYPESPTGLSVIEYARNAIGLGLAAEEFGSRFFGQGAHMTGVISVDQNLTKETARGMKEAFDASHTGMKNAHSIGILSGGAKWTPISVSPDDAQFLGTRAAQNIDIAMLFGIPPHMLGQVDRTTSWGTGIEQQSLGFLRYTLAPWLHAFEDAWSSMLSRPTTARFDVDDLLRTDTLGRWQMYQIARNIAGMTPDEIRAKENEPPLPNGAGKDPFAPLNSAHTTDPGWTPGEPEPVPVEKDPVSEPEPKPKKGK